MRNEDIIRAWKDQDFHNSLPDETLAHLPTHPAGLIEINNEDLEVVAGGDPTTLSVILITEYICPHLSDWFCEV